MRNNPCGGACGLVVFLATTGGSIRGQESYQPFNSIEVLGSLNFQLPATVNSTVGNASVVEVSKGVSGFRGEVRYGMAISGRTRLLLGAHAESVAFRFIWSGPHELLGPLDTAEDRPVGLPLERWALYGVGADLETAFVRRGAYRLLGGIGILISRGSGSASYAWRYDGPDTAKVQSFGYQALLNQDRKLIPSLRFSLKGERTIFNLNSLSVGIALKLGLWRSAVHGTYSTVDSETVDLSGEFHSSLTAIEMNFGYAFTWGYPKVPKRLQE